MADPRSLTCVVADDHPAIVDSVSLLLGVTGEIEVVGSAVDSAGALSRIRDLQPHVAIVDADLPHLGVVDLTRRLAAESGNGTAIVVYAEHADADHAYEAMEAGARGFILKGAPLGEVTRAVRAVGAGRTFVDAGLGATLGAPKNEEPSILTHREREVLSLLADGLRNEEVAEQLSISPPTVSSHVKHAMEKLHAGSRTEAVATALRRSLIL